MNKFSVCLCFFLLMGCASLEDKIESSLERRLELFEKTSFNFEKAMRWGYYELAYDFIKKDGTSQPPPDFIKLRDVKVSTYEVMRSTISNKEMQALQSVEIRYYNVNTLMEKSLLYEERWEFDRDKKQWYLVSEFPDFQ